ncbi:hypothetical protein DPEC_G00171040 [Dallia pectoralis]|uniref:Uncharacterized protein n=1 Tax=Dallia pectoralis TaxID=75939 RepID=A0ACC2GCY7_DALPE|nr:hypothetical protein DPEC_G00171040 [Dallia pectoralis]
MNYFISLHRNRKATTVTADYEQGDSVYVNVSSMNVTTATDLTKTQTTDQTSNTTDNKKDVSVYENVSSLDMTPSEKDRQGKSS